MLGHWVGVSFSGKLLINAFELHEPACCTLYANKSWVALQWTVSWIHHRPCLRLMPLTWWNSLSEKVLILFNIIFQLLLAPEPFTIFLADKQRPGQLACGCVVGSRITGCQLVTTGLRKVIDSVADMWPCSFYVSSQLPAYIYRS